MLGRVWVKVAPPRSGDAAHADVAQLVAHHLAKVRVAGSNPVVRSDSTVGPPTAGGVAEWLRQGPAKPCTRVRFPPPPRAISSVGERFLDTEEVTSSILVSPTTRTAWSEPQMRTSDQAGSHDRRRLRSISGAWPHTVAGTGGGSSSSS